MADIQVRIKLNAGVDGDQINSVAFSQETNNVSKVIGSKTTKNDGQNLISWGENGLIHIDEYGNVGGEGTLGEQNGYNGFVFGVVPSNKQYSVEVTLEGSNIDSVTFYGDRKANQFPTRAILNGEYIYSDDPEWTIVFPNALATQTITFDMWNRGNYNACFTHIAEFSNELVLDKRWIKSVESLSQSTGQPKEIHYGVTPSRGNLKILDINGEIRDYITDKILDVNNLNVALIVNGKEISKQTCIDVDYDINSKLFSANLTNYLKTDFPFIDETISISFKDYTGRDYIDLKAILETYIFNTNIDSMLEENVLYTEYSSKDDISMTIGEYLTRIKLKYLYVVNKKRSEILNYICNIAQIALVKSSDSSYRFVSLRPKAIPSNVINITKNKVFGNLKFDVVLNNKYTKVIANYKDVYLVRENIYERSINLKEENYSNAPYSTNAIGLNSTVTSLSDFVAEYVKFFDSLSYTESEFPLFDDSSRWSITKTAQPAEILNTRRLELSSAKIEDFASSADIPNASNSKIILLNKDANRDNNVPYDFSICIDATPYNKLEGEGGYEYYNFDKVDIAIVGNKYRVNDNQIVFGDGENSVEIGENPLLTQGTVIIDNNTEVQMAEILSKNILEDYAEGVRTATCQVACLDYYDLEGNLQKTWDEGEIIEVGNLVKVDGYNGIWRVTGSNFRKGGIPMIDLELQEVKYDKYYLKQESHTENQTFELSGGNGVLDIVYYKTMAFDKTNGTITFSDVAVLSDLVVGAKVYWVSDPSDVSTFDEIEFTSIPSGNALECTANITTYSIKKSYS